MTTSRLLPNHLPALMTVEGTAEQLGVSRARCYQLIADGTLPSVKVGRLRRIALVDLENYLRTLRESA